MQGKFLHNKNGSILVEALVALSFAVIVFSAALYLVTSSFGYNREITNKYTGVQLADEGIEIVKNIVDNNVIQCRAWNTGIASGDYEAGYGDASLTPIGQEPRKLKLNSSAGLYGYNAGNEVPFYRVITITNYANRIRVESAVSWISKYGGSDQMSVIDYFYNWRTGDNIPTQCR